MNRPRLLAVSQLRRSDKRFESTISNSRGRLPMEPSGLINSVLLKLLSQLAIHLDTSKSVPTCTRWWRAQNQVDCIRKKNANYLSIIVVYRASNDFVPIASTDFIFTTDWSVVWHTEESWWRKCICLCSENDVRCPNGSRKISFSRWRHLVRQN